MVAGAVIAKAYVELATGFPNLDRVGIRARVLLYAGLNGVPAPVLMGIVHQESGGNPNNYLGDVGAPGGPSIGPGQVYRQTAKDLGLWSAPKDGSDEKDAYAALSQDEDLGIKWAAKVLAVKIADAGGDIPDGVRRYNGSGPNAQAYRDNVLAFVSSTYGGTVLPEETPVTV